MGGNGEEVYTVRKLNRGDQDGSVSEGISAKPDNLNLNHGIYFVEGENQLLPIVL